jgi:uncharacterized membrane protein YtjA (UPF0391 family)
VKEAAAFEGMAATASGVACVFFGRGVSVDVLLVLEFDSHADTRAPQQAEN